MGVAQFFFMLAAFPPVWQDPDDGTGGMLFESIIPEIWGTTELRSLLHSI